MGVTLDVGCSICEGNSLISDPAVHPKAFDWQAAFPEAFDKIIGPNMLITGRPNAEMSSYSRAGLDGGVHGGVLPWETFVAAITQHIPDKGAQRVRYYDWYSNKMRGVRYRRLSAGHNPPPNCPPEGVSGPYTHEPCDDVNPTRDYENVLAH